MLMVHDVGHQKKIMLAIDRLKRISGSLRRVSSNKRSTVDSPCARHVQRTVSNEDAFSATAGMPVSSPSALHVLPAVQFNGPAPDFHTTQLHTSDACGNMTPRCSGADVGSFVSPYAAAAGPFQPSLNSVAELRADVSGDGISRHSGHQSLASAAVVVSHGLKSDGDATPTNERRLMPSHLADEFSQPNVASRPAAYVVPSPKPVAMVTAKAKLPHNGSDVIIDSLQSARSHSVTETPKGPGINCSYGTLPKKFCQRRQLAAENGEDLGNVNHADATLENATCPSKSPAAVLCLERSKERLQVDANSNCHVVKREPPIPPKRTHSFKTDLRLPASNQRASSDGPHSNSIPRSTLTSSCSNGDASCKASAAGSTDLFGGAENILNEVIERLERGSSGDGGSSVVRREVVEQLEHGRSGSSTVRRHTGPRLGDWQDCRLSNDSSSGSEDSDSGLDSRRSESNTSLDAAAGGVGLHSSADMNTLPFANENVGTIKQRGSSSSKPTVVTVADNGVIELNSTLFAPSTNNCSTSSASVAAHPASVLTIIILCRCPFD